MPLILSEQQQQHLSQLLQREIELARALKTSLDVEFNALSNPDTQDLERVVGEKQEIINALESMGKQRETQLKALGVLKNTQAADEVNRVFSATRELSEQWNELLRLAADCQDKNRINGSIVELGVRHSINALEILRGNNAGSNSDVNLYDNSGHTSNAAEKRTIAQA